MNPCSIRPRPHSDSDADTLLLVMSEVRTATVARKTNETDIVVSLTLDVDPSVKQEISVNTGIGFLDHVCSIEMYALGF